MWNNFFNTDLTERRLSYVFNNKELLFSAFVHRSYWNENQREVKESNERLEFLGDSVLNLIVSEYLYETLPSLAEGRLSDLRSRIVEASSCAFFVRKLALEEFLLVGRGERMQQGKGRETMIADLFEAIIGAIYLDGGIEEVRSFFLKNFVKDIESLLLMPSKNAKAELQDYAQRRYAEAPQYEVVEEWGLPHAKNFRVIVSIQKEKVGEGRGSSKKEAEKQAAAEALKKLVD